MKDKTEHGRGTINHNALAAIVTSRIFRARIEKSKKGKGTKYSRKSKHKSSSYKTDELFVYYMAI